MKRKTITIFSISTIAVFIFSVVFLITNLAVEYSHGQKRAERTVSHITAAIKKGGASGIQSAADNLRDYQGLYLYKNAEPVFRYPQKDEGTMSDTNMVKVSVISIPRGQDTYTLKAAVYLLRPSSIFYYARISFTIILIATLFTVSLLTYISFTEPKTASVPTKRKKTEADKIEDGTEAEGETDAENAQTRQDTIEETFEPKNAALQTTSSPEAERGRTAEQSGSKGAEDAGNEDLTEKASLNAETDTAPRSADENAPYEDAVKAPSETLCTDGKDKPAENGSPESGENSGEPKKDFFSPVTGFGWEHNFQVRLENELIRAASSEADLSLFIIKIPGLRFTDVVCKNIATSLLEEFQFRDMIFEFGDDGFAVIKTDTTILKAEEIAGTLHSRLTKIIEAAALSCFIGISSRSTRMLSADRLILEAEEALNRSIDDPSSPITAFHVDIDKYRDFLKNN